MEDLQQLLAEAFTAELAEHLAAIRAGLTLAAAGGAPDLRDIFRRAHSLKGAARAVDREDIEGIAHALESLLADVERGARPLDPPAIEEVRDLLNAIEDMAAPSAPAGEPAPIEDVAESVRVASRPLERLAETVRTLQGDLEARALIASDLRDTRAEIESIRTACLAAGARLPDIAARLSRLLASTGAIAGRRVAADWQVERTAGQLAGEAERILLAPAATLVEGLERMVRNLAAEEGKEAELIIVADAVEADRRVLQGLRDPLTHLIRNAIGHGIEAPAARARAGKPARAMITIELRDQAGQLLLAVEDDGAGPDVPAIVRAARARGAIVDGVALSEEAALSLVFEHGVSTSAGVDRLSGRGVGLAVVADAARRLHGGARMMRGVAGGTRLELSVPLAITRRTMLLVEAGGQTFAVPTRGAYRAIRFEAVRIEMHGGAPMLPVEAAAGEKLWPIVSLAGLLGLPTAPTTERIEAFALRLGERTSLVAVDALRDVRTLAIGEAEAIAVDTPLVLGSVLIGEGQLALVLSPEALAERIARGGKAIAPPVAEPRRRQATILVVDDSITTRTLERGILESQGYRVLLSVDGIDGLETLRARRSEIDLVVADVEMPRMDGFGLLSAIRNDPLLADIPVVMMTSRNSPDDIQRGLDLGAHAYVTKQEFDQGTLLATVGRLI